MYRVLSDKGFDRFVQRMQQRAAATVPLARRVGEFIAREARRRAPVGTGRNRGALRRSLNYRLIDQRTIVLQSPLVYASIQQRGGTITAGKGPLAARCLAIPVNDAAKRLMESLGASRSLREVAGLSVIPINGVLYLMGTPGLKEAQQRAAEKKAAGKKARRARTRDYLVIFVLKRSVSLKPNPAPAGYAPRINDPALRRHIGQAVRRHLKGSEA